MTAARGQALIRRLPVLAAMTLVAAMAFVEFGPYHIEPMRENLEGLDRPPGIVDRADVPLGPYRLDLSGLAGGFHGEDSLGVYVVMRTREVHLKREGEEREYLKDRNLVAVTPLSIGFQRRADPTRIWLPPVDMQWVDGLAVDPLGRKHGDLRFYTPYLRDATGHPLMSCNFTVEAANRILETHTFANLREGDGYCSAYFRPKADIVAMVHVPTTMLGRMFEHLPQLYRLVCALITS